jgi:hypothetical protein
MTSPSPAARRRDESIEGQARKLSDFVRRMLQPSRRNAAKNPDSGTDEIPPQRIALKGVEALHPDNCRA